MAIFRCNKCTHIQEVNNKLIDKKAKCPKCEYPITIYDTINFSNILIQRYYNQNSKLKELQDKITQLENLNQDVIENNPIGEIDIYDTKALMHIDR